MNFFFFFYIHIHDSTLYFWARDTHSNEVRDIDLFFFFFAQRENEIKTCHRLMNY